MHDDRDLLELLTLEGAQAGLSWSTVLAKREGYKRIFKNFDAKKIVVYPGIVRNLLRLYASQWHGERPFGGVLSV
jgi:DNA-3-methyladenine glycosylase I